jgi:peptide-methionine (S)-S-oxide reductase
MEAYMELATFAGGCFWCLDAVFSELPGVDRVTSGYCGGYNLSPSYEQVCSGTTGHAEAIRISFDPLRISYRQLLAVFFAIHDPTTLNRQGADVGTQYRSAIFVHSEEQRAEASTVIQEFSTNLPAGSPIVTEVVDATEFFPAEPYHQGYFAKNPGQGYCAVVINPKLAAFRHQFAELLKNPGR